MTCNELQFKQSASGQRKINYIKSNYSTQSRPIVDNYFTTGFLKQYYTQNTNSIDQNILNCYESLLDFWAKDRAAALNAEYQLSEGNKAYQAWLKNYKSPIDSIGDTVANIFQNIPLLIGAVLVISLINITKK